MEFRPSLLNFFTRPQGRNGSLIRKIERVVNAKRFGQSGPAHPRSFMSPQSDRVRCHRRPVKSGLPPIDSFFRHRRSSNAGKLADRPFRSSDQSFGEN